MTATMETTAVAAPESVTTLDGETRAVVKSWPDGAWDCPFCHYPTKPDTGRRGWDGPCDNPLCIVGGSMTPTGTAQHRERQAEYERRETERKRREDFERQQAERKAQAEAERKAAHAEWVGQAELTGFAWACSKDGEEPCKAGGTERAGYLEHMREHGARITHSAVKPIRLRKHAPAASLPKLPCSPFKFITWTESHTEPGICQCGHASTEHNGWHGNDGVTYKCGECNCVPGIYGLPPATTQEADRRGQFWAVGPDSHSVWVLPFELAPWESKREPVLLYAGRPGKFHTSAYSAKYDRR